MSDLLSRIPSGTTSVSSPLVRQSLRMSLRGMGRAQEQRGLTSAEEDLLPYIQEEARQEADRRGLLRPLEAVFDILQRGQYLTANVAQQLIDNMRSGRPLMNAMPRAISSAVTGKVKGDWKNVLFGGTTKEGRDVEGVFDWDPQTKGGKFAKNVAGFLANVALDPTTYLSFGASSAARQAATRFADDAVLKAIGSISRNADDVLPELIQEGLNPKLLKQAWAKSPDEAFAYLQKFAGEDITRLYTKIHKEAYRKALRTPASELGEELSERISKDVTDLVKVKGVGGAASEGVQRSAQAATGLLTDSVSRDEKAVSNFVRRRRGPDVMFSGDFSGMPGQIAGETGEAYSKRLLEYLGDNPYAGAGTRAWRLFRKEFNISERYPGWLKRLDDFKDRFRESGIGGKFSDAWWKWMEHSRSPVATIRRALRIRNPYQKLLSVFERDVQEKAFHELLADGEAISAVMKGLTDAEKKAVTGAMIFSQISQEEAKKASVKAAAARAGRMPGSPMEEAARIMRDDEWVQEPVTLTAQELAQKFAPEQELDNIVDAIEKINSLTDEWLAFNRKAHGAGLASSIGEWEDYLPAQPSRNVGWKKAGRQLGGMQAGYMHQREVGFGGHLRQQAEKIKWMFGMDADQAAEAITSNFSNLNVDLADLLTRRAFAQARFRQRVHMIESFKQFGIDVSDLKTERPDLYQALAGKWGNLEPLGMKTIDDPVLEGVLFDADVAEIFERAVQTTSSGIAWDNVSNAFNNFTSWWRGWATLSPGFHARNFMSNNMTGFLKHGVAWLDPEAHIDSIIMTHVALHGKEGAIKKLHGFGEDFVRARLAKRVGDYTLEELAEYAGTTGLATRVTRGFHKPKDYDELVKLEGRLFEDVRLNPFKRDFVGMEASHAIGSYVESEARLASFLIDLKKGVGRGANQQAALEWAKREAKKWFIDYGDLSQVEQGALRNLMPFYTWLRGNIANQISGLMIMPEMYGVVAKGLDAVSNQSVEKEELPDWARELGMVPVGPAEGGKTRFFWPNFPFQDLNRIPLRFRETEAGIPIPQFTNPQDLIADVVSDSHPVIKTVVELATNKDVFYQNEIGETEKAPRALRVLTKHRDLLPFLDGALRQVGFSDGLRADVDNEGRLVIDGRIARVLRNNVLMLDMIPKYFDAVEVVFPAIERWKRDVVGAVDDYEALEELFQVFSFYLGVKVKDIDIAEHEFYRNYEMLERARDERSREQKKLPGSERRSLEWRDQQQGVFRRLGL